MYTFNYDITDRFDFKFISYFYLKLEHIRGKKRDSRVIWANEIKDLPSTCTYMRTEPSCHTTCISLHLGGETEPQNTPVSFPEPLVSHMYNTVELKSSRRKSSLLCYYTHQTSLIRQQQNFINRLDIMEWACYKWALSKPYSATKWVFSVHCSHLKHHRWCRITNDCY